MRNFKYFILVIVLSCTGVAAQVSPTMPPPKRNITGPSRHRPAGADHPESTAGTIEGFVYWDENSVRHTPANSCSGLAITVSVGSSSNSPFTAYTPLGTLSNNFKYVGQVKEFLAGGKVIVYDVCTYGYDKVPVGPPLQVKLTVTQPSVFSPASTPQVEILGPITIINGQCNMLPRIVNPNASDLAARWGTCQNMAYDVNFVMQNPHVLGLSSGAGTPSGSGNVRVEKNLVPSRSPLLKDARPAGTPMLTGSTQQGMLATGAGSTTQSPSTTGGLQENRGQAPPAITNGTRQTYTGTTRSITPQTLTNADVVGMLKAGLAESVIISSIRSARKNFDFSPAGCHAFQQARLSVGILTVMGDGSVRPCPEITGPGGKGALNPQSPPGSKTGSPNSVVLKPIKLAPPKALRKVTNPRLAQENGSIIAVLERQGQAAQQESAAMKLGIRSVASTVSARAPAAATFQGSAGVQNLGPEMTQSEKGNLASSIIHAPAFNSIVLTCTNDPSPRIIQLSGGEGHGIFTPEAKYNLYTITGCSFGQSQSGNSAYIYGMNGFKANLNIDFWSDNGVTAHLDPSLAGVLDQNNVTLVIAPEGKQQIKKSGYQFYAARGMPVPGGNDQDIPLAYDSMPQASVSLFNASPVLAGYDQVSQNGTSQFPSFSFQGTPVAGWVFRYAYGHEDPYQGVNSSACFINDVGYQITYASDPCWQYFADSPQLGADTWDFSKLVSGFVISSYELYYEDTDPTQLCGSWDQMDKKSGLLQGWDFNLATSTQITVTWPLYWCRDTELPPSVRKNEQKQSAYGLAVWVLGPRCVEPWTGQKDQSCMNKVKQLLD